MMPLDQKARRTFLALLLLGGATAVVGCKSEQGAPTPEAAVAASVMPDLTIGRGDGPVEYLFYAVADLLVKADGEIWVLDGGILSGRPIIRRFNAEGRFLAQVGRTGEGPAEYRNPYAMAELPGGRVVVRDHALPNVMHLFLPDGSYDTAWVAPTPLTGIPGASESLQVDASGIVWVQIVEGRPGPGGPRPTSYVRMLSDGSILDTVWAPDVSAPSPEVIEVTQGAATHRLSIPFQTRPFVAWAPSGLFAVGETSRYAVDFLPPLRAGERASVRSAGTPAGTIARQVPPVLLSESERDDHRSFLIAEVVRYGGTSSTRIPDIPAVKPALSHVYFGEDGLIWVRVSVPSVEVEVEEVVSQGGSGQIDQQMSHILRWREPAAFDVFETDGTFLGRVVLPPGACDMFARTLRLWRDDIWCVSRDQNGVEVIRRYRVLWAEP